MSTPKIGLRWAYSMSPIDNDSPAQPQAAMHPNTTSDAQLNPLPIPTILPYILYMEPFMNIKALLFLVLSCVLTACGGGGGSFTSCADAVAVTAKVRLVLVSSLLQVPPHTPGLSTRCCC